MHRCTGRTLRLPLFAAVSGVLLAGHACASSSTAPGHGSSSRVLIHMKIGMKHDDNPACVAFNVAWAALEAGKNVDILYDAGAVFDLQIPGAGATSQPTSRPATGPASMPASQPSTHHPTGDHPPDMPYSLRYALPPKLKQILADQFGVPTQNLPATYYDYLKMLKDRGANIYVNAGMAHLVSLTDSLKGRERITKLAEPATFKKMIELREGAAIYYVY